MSLKKSINILQKDTSKPLGHSSRIQTDQLDTNIHSTKCFPTTAETHSIGNVDRSNSIKIFHVDESYTKQDTLHKKYSNK